MMADGRSAFMGVLFLLLFYYITGNIEIASKPWRNKDFKIVHQNIRGLFTKKELLEYFITENNIQIIGVTETLLNEHIPSQPVNINGYNFERRDRESSGGGVGAYIKKGIEYLRRFDLECCDIEFICLEIFSPHTKPFFVCILYRPPDSSKHLSKSFTESFQKTLTRSPTKTKNF